MINKARYFELNYHRHGEQEWQITIGNEVHLTKYVEIDTPVVTKFKGTKAMICGIGFINITKNKTVITGGLGI